MRGLLLLLFIGFPVLELLLLFEVSDVIGGLATIALLLLAAIIGIQILRHQGLSTLMRANQKMSSGQIPALEMAEGVFLTMGGVFLLLPGFISDALGLLCLLPFSRRWLVRGMLKLKPATFQFYGSHAGFGSSWQGRTGQQHSSQHDVYEGEFTREQPPEKQINREEL